MDILPLDNVFWMAIALFFFVTLFGALARRLKRDRRLLLFHTHHVTLFCDGKQPVQGDLHVTSRGVELVLTAAREGYRTMAPKHAGVRSRAVRMCHVSRIDTRVD